MRNHTYLTKRGSVYYCRMPVPKAYQKKLGKKEVWKSLGVACYYEAKHRLKEQLFSLSLDFWDMNDTSNSQQLTLRQIPKLLDVVAKEIFEEYLLLKEQAIFAGSDKDLRDDLRNKFIEEQTAKLKLFKDTETNEFNYTKKYTENFLIRHSIQFTESSTEFGLLLIQLQEIVVKVLEDIISRSQSSPVIKGEIVFRNMTLEASQKLARKKPDMNKFQNMLEDSINHDIATLTKIRTGRQPQINFSSYSDQRSMTFGELVEAFNSDMKNQTLPLRERQNRNTFQKVFFSLVGKDKDISNIDRPFLKEIMNKLSQLPARMNTSKEFKDKQAREAIELANKLENIPRISVTTANNYFEYLVGLLKYAAREGYITAVPNVEKIAPVDKVLAKEKRDPFEAEEINLILNSNDVLDNKFSDKAHKFWLPVIAFLTGMREGEIAQLRVKDIREEYGITYIDINSEAGKKVKNSSSIRKVPVSDLLKKIGFLKYVHMIKQRGHQSLFPSLTVNADRPSDAYSKQFGRMIRKLGITNPKKVFHSFRHTFEDAERNTKNINNDAIKVLCGWSGQGVHSNYGKGYSLEILKDNLDLIQFKNMKLEHLFESELG